MSVSDVTTPTVANGRLEVSSTIRSLELTVVASDFRPVASGFGRLSAELPPGFYEIVARAGPITDRRLVRLPPGETVHVSDIDVEFPSAAPVAGTSTTHEPHMALAEEASRAIGSSPTGTGLVIMVRDVRGSEAPPLDAGDLAPIAVLDAHLQPLPDIDKGWRIDAANAAATWAGTLPPGGCAIRVTPSRTRSSASGRPFPTQAVDQSVWLAPGWQTVVFITTGESGLRVDRASVHMTHLGLAWMPYERDIGLALELALWGVREGRATVPDDLLSVLLGSKFVNPMLGIVGAHALLLRHEVPMDVLDVVLRNLDGLVPGHPDVLALHHLANERRAALGTPPAPVGTPIAWPPMLLRSFHAAIRADARDPGVIADGSIAEAVAGSLLAQDVWTSWRPIAALPPAVAAPRPPAPAPAPGGAPRHAERTAGAAPRETVMDRISADPAALDGVASRDPATARVLRYLGTVVALEGDDAARRLRGMSPSEIALGATLPAASVDRALVAIANVLPPPSGGGSDGGSETRPEPRPKPDGGPGGGGSGRWWLRPPVVLGLAAALLLAGTGGAEALGVIDVVPDWPSRAPAPTDVPPTAAPDVTAAPVTPAPVTPPPVTAPPVTLAPPTVAPETQPPVTTPPTAPPSTAPPVTDAPVLLRAEPNALGFGSVTVGDQSPSVDIVVSQDAGPPIAISDWNFPGDDFPFDIGDCAGLVLEPGVTCTAKVAFAPVDVGDRTGEIVFFGSDGVTVFVIPLLGTGLEPTPGPIVE